MKRKQILLLFALLMTVATGAWAASGDTYNPLKKSTSGLTRGDELQALPEGTVYVSASGNDENDGLSEATAIATLAHAVDIVKARENKTATVYVLNGDYTTDVIDVSDDVCVSLTILGQEKGKVVIRGTGAYIFDIYGDNLVWSFKNLVFDGLNSTARTSAALVLYSEEGDFTVDNCNFRNINSKLGAIAIGNDEGNTNVTNCIIESVTGSASSTSILTVNSNGKYVLDNIEIKNCKLDESVASSTTSSYLRSIIYVNNYEADVTISNSKIHNNNGPMMSLIESKSKLTIVDTEISGNVVNTSANGANGGDALIWASNDNSDINISQCTITGNEIVKSGKGLFYNQKGSMNVEYSDISENTADAFIGSTGTISANNNWWGTSSRPDAKVDKWVIMNVDVDDSDLAENNKLTLTIDFNHVKTSSFEIEELTGGEIPKESYTVAAAAQKGEITPASVVVNKGDVKSQTFTVTETSDVITLTCDGDAVPITIEGVPRYRGTIYVATTGSDDNEGSENAPVATIGKAVELALVNNGSGKIIINEGTYVGNGYHVTGDLTVTGNGKVTLDANNEGRFFYMEYGESANKIELHNLTLTKANGFGAAVYSFANVLVLDKVTIVKNNADGYLIKSNGKLTITDSEISESMSGNVIQQDNSGNILIKNSVFKKNSVVDNTSVMAVVNINSGSGKIVVEDSKFIENTARQGVIKGNFIYDIEVKGTEFRDNTNTVSYGGAIYSSGGKLDITDCVFDNNKAYRSGGAIYGGYRVTATVDSCIFINNTANTMNDEYYGDAIYNGNKLTVTNSAFLGDYDNFMIYNDGEDNVVTAQNCWWGTNEDPSSMNGHGYYEDENWEDQDCPQVDASNWATLDAAFTPADAQAGEEVTVTATFSNDKLPDGIPVTFTSTSGNLNAVVSTVGAQASTTYTIDANDEAITATSGNATIDMPIVSTIVTQSNFYTFFDANGELLDAVTTDELTFQGEFSNTVLGVSIITLDRPITITGDNAKLNNIAVYVSGSDVTLDNISVIYNAPADAEANAIFANGADNFKLINSEITFTGANPGSNHYRGLEVRNCNAAQIDNNTITATFPAVPVDWSGSGIAQDLVLAVGIQGGDDVEFTKNTVTVNTNGSIGSYPTIDAVMVYSANNILIKENDITHLDNTAEDSPRYYYSLDIYSTTGTVEANDITVNTTTTAGDDRAGTAYSIQLTGPFTITVKDNNITAISNGPAAGIYATNWPGESNLTAENNIINVTGYATTGNYALVAGIEAEIDVFSASNNTITVANGADYDDANQVIGVGIMSSYFYGDVSADIEGNTITVDGKYAVYYTKAENTSVTGNTLYAHELTGDDAVYIANGSENIVVVNNLPSNSTGIKYIRTQNTDGTELYYDLSGRRIEKPTAKGIYIHNGKKVLLK